MSTQPPSQSTKTYHGSCHCGKIVYTVTSPALEETEVVECNCSICRRNGYLLIYRPDADMVFEKGEEELTPYQFGQHRIAHYFCPACGTSIFGRSVKEDFFPGMRAINVRTLEDVDCGTLKKKAVDGKNM